MKNQKVVDAFQSGLAGHMEELRGLVVGGVGVQQQQLRTLEEQLHAFLEFKDQVFRPNRVHVLVGHGVLLRVHGA